MVKCCLVALFLVSVPQIVMAQTSGVDAPAESVTVSAAKAGNARPTTFLSGGSRWLFPICPITVGLVPAENSRVTERIRQVAELVGAPFWKRGRCNTNAEIVFTDKPQDFLDTVADKRYRLLGGQPRQEKRPRSAIPSSPGIPPP